jgi:hypothetical protein
VIIIFSVTLTLQWPEKRSNNDNVRKDKGTISSDYKWYSSLYVYVQK